MNRIELRVDVSAAAGAASGPIEIAATVHLPTTLPMAQPPIAIFAIPGGGYSRGYFDMHFPGHRGYSQAAHHTNRGILFIALDPLGVGESSLGDPTKIGFADLASTYDRAVRQIVEKLRAGSLAPELPPLPGVVNIGIGQSMGGCISILTQARHATFDAVAPLGYSAVHTMLPQRTEEARRQAAAVHDYAPGAVLDADTIARTSAQIPDFVYPFHWEDVPTDILAADMDGGYPLRTKVPPFGSATIPACAVLMMSPGAVKAEAAAIEVPILIGVGERDTCPDPHAEPAAYPSSRDVSLFIVPRMAHMHNFAGTRGRLWERLLHWSTTISSERMAE
jgi:pimeloyl-ACP methyl ester carboxylesterase